MTSNTITGVERKLAKIFCADYTFIVPPYQRPYAWTTEEANELFDDLLSFYQDNDKEPYFLGSIVLIKDGDTTKHLVIDGQQRLTTLSILISCLASKVDPNIKHEYLGYLVEPGKDSEDIPEHPRIYLREKDQAFFNKHIQKGSIEELIKTDPAQLQNESQRNIYNNTIALIDRINKKLGDDKDEVKAYAKYMINNCFLVTVTTYNQNTANRVFSVLNTRGLDLLPTDIIKADLCENLSEEKVEDLTKKWESLEDFIGRDGLKDLMGHIRMIYAKSKAKKELLVEYHEHIKPRIQDPSKYVTDVLDPLVECYNIVKNSAYRSTENALEINSLIKWLRDIENTDWMPVALMFLEQKRNDSTYVLWFMKKLERLSAYIYLSSKDINQRIDRYKDIISEMEGDHSMKNPLKTIELNVEEKEEFKTLINDDIYRNGNKGLPVRKCGYLLLRLDSFISDKAAEYTRSILTIEHILPQTVKENTEWAVKWPDKDVRDNWLLKLANLVPLTIRRNISASNFDFDTKKTKYFRGTDSVTTYTLTQQVVMLKEWTPDIVANRQTELTNKITDKWELN